MATSTFDKRMIVTNPKSVEKLYQLLISEKQDKPINKELFSPSERVRSEQILIQCLSHNTTQNADETGYGVHARGHILFYLST